MINKKVVGVTTVNLGDISEPFEGLSDATKVAWKHQIFFRIHMMLKCEYFDNFLEIHQELDEAGGYSEK